MDTTSNTSESTRVEPNTAQLGQIIDTSRQLFDRMSGHSLSECRLAQQLETPATYDTRIEICDPATEENIQADPAWRLRGMLERLDAVERLGRNWDSYASEPPTATAVQKARALVWDVVGEGFGVAGLRSIPFAIVPLSGAGLQIEWRGENDSIEVEIGSDGALGFLLSRGRESNREFEEADNVSEHELVRRTLAAVS
jgi:hypothetical protein